MEEENGVGARRRSDDNEPNVVRKCILVTGGGGYLGNHIGHSLASKGFDVVLFDLREPMPVWEKARLKRRKMMEEEKGKITFVRGDICQKEQLSSCLSLYRISGLIHTASFGMSGTENLPAFADVTERVNVQGTRNIIAAAKENMVEALVYTSTVNVVFTGDPIIDGREEHLPYFNLSQHTDHYSRTKQIAEELVLASSSHLGGGNKELHTCSLRLNGIYGPHEQRHMPRIIEIIRKDMAVAGFGLDTKQDMIHRDNAVQAHVKALECLLDPARRQRVSGQAYFISDGQPMNNTHFFLDPLLPAIKGKTMKEMVEVPFVLVLVLSWLPIILSWILGKRFKMPCWAMTPTEAYKTGVTHYFSIEKAKKHFGYEPEVKWNQESWDEILNSYGLKRPTKLD